MTSMVRAGGASAMQGARRSRSSSVPPSGSISGTVQHGATLTLTGSDYTSLQWLHNGSPISGETGSTYTVDRADSVLDGGDITCEMTGPGGVVESNALVYYGADLPTAVWFSDEDVTLVGGEVDSWASSGGSVSCTLTAPGATNRPAYNATGGVGSRPLITFDGTDDVLTGAITIGTTHGDTEYAVTGARVSFSTLGDRWIGYNNGGATYYGLQDRTATNLYQNCDTGSLIASGGDPDTNNQRWWAIRQEPTDSASLGYGTTTTQSSVGGITGANNRADGGSVHVGAQAGGTAAANIAAQGVDFGQLLTSDQRTDLRSLLTGRTGIAA